MITGDAMGKPLIEALRRAGADYDLSSLLAVVSSAALFSAPVKDQFFEHLPNLVITDAIGSSEGGNNGMTVVTAGQHGHEERADRARCSGDTVVFDEDLELGGARVGRHRQDRPLGRHPARLLQRPREDGRGVHRGGRHPVRHARRLRHRRGGRVDHPARPWLDRHQLGRREDLPRGGGVGRALAPRRDGRHRRAGHPTSAGARRVAAIMQPRAGHEAPSLESLQEHCRESIAGYKVPRRLHVVDTVERSPSGKPDYTWAADHRGAGRRSPEQGDLAAPSGHPDVLSTSNASGGVTVPAITRATDTHRPAGRSTSVGYRGRRSLSGSAADQPAPRSPQVPRSRWPGRRRGSSRDVARRPHDVVDRLPRRPARLRRRQLGCHLLAAQLGLDVAGPRRPGLRRTARGDGPRLRGHRERHRVRAGGRHRRRPVVHPRGDPGAFG